jgi:co-chaperonin GroES (HSP10)
MKSPNHTTRGNTVAAPKFSKEIRIPLTDLTLTPAPGFLLVKKINGSYIQSSGLLVPKAERMEGYLAEVLAVSPISRVEYGVTIPPFVSKGAIVVLTTYASGQNMTKEDGETLLIQESHVAGVVARSEYDEKLAIALAAQEESQNKQA